jgi:3-polyprenyl-4-hydroxybenzoate decarboxylase
MKRRGFFPFDRHHDAQVALNVIGSWPNHAMMLGMPKDTPVKEQFFESRDSATSR